MSYACFLGLAPPSSQATRLHPGKAKSYEPKALNETMLPMRRKKIITISHTQQFPLPFRPKRKNGDMRKRGDPHQEQETVNNGKRTERKLKENKIIKLIKLK